MLKVSYKNIKLLNQPTEILSESWCGGQNFFCDNSPSKFTSNYPCVSIYEDRSIINVCIYVSAIADIHSTFLPKNVRHFNTPPFHSPSSLQFLSHSSIYPSVFLHHLSKHQILLISSTSSPVFKRQIRHFSHPDICMFLSVCPVLKKLFVAYCTLFSFHSASSYLLSFLFSLFSFPSCISASFSFSRSRLRVLHINHTILIQSERQCRLSISAERERRQREERT